MSSYTRPVNRLLDYHPLVDVDELETLDFSDRFDIGPEHIPDLIRMATDKDLMGEEVSDLEFAAPYYAMLALKQFHATEAVEPLLSLFDLAQETDNEWISEDLPQFYAAFGPETIPVLVGYMSDISHHPFARTNAANALKEISELHPEVRTQCIEAIAHALETEPDSEDAPAARGFLISDLIDLEAKEAAPVIERAFAQQTVDESIAGDWDEVQVELGLKDRSELPEKPRFNPFASPPPLDLISSFRPGASGEKYLKGFSEPPKASKKKHKEKMAKASRKKNRKR
ncbi:MAG TPA: DUF1186 domain-containing protein [Ktedonosporobacter sp.]|nr:DUF1186 domain-containing protein [Ktedonosporobacter sp.]